MAFDYTAVTAGVRDADTEAFLTKLDGHSVEAQLAEKAKLADQSDPFVVADDAEYASLIQATKIYLSNVK